ncbi:hypothetical protein QN360_15910, partial [Glaciimonas sp. CA11.2]|uniref:hypothetical protein n=1 Tax=Glaciimonas sp. CA11.2 TaxID=3048601 RepID=UPI002B23B1C6
IKPLLPHYYLLQTYGKIFPRRQKKLATKRMLNQYIVAHDIEVPDPTELLPGPAGKPAQTYYRGLHGPHA